MDYSAAKKRADAEKAQLKQLENTRHRAERMEEKNRQRAIAEARTLQRRCTTLAMRKKWSEEDAAGISSRSTRRAKKNAQRLAEQFAAECIG